MFGRPLERKFWRDQLGDGKSKGWYGNALKAKFNLPSSHGGDKDNTNTKYVKWWLKKQVTKHMEIEEEVAEDEPVEAV